MKEKDSMEHHLSCCLGHGYRQGDLSGENENVSGKRIHWWPSQCCGHQDRQLVLKSEGCKEDSGSTRVGGLCPGDLHTSHFWHHRNKLGSMFYISVLQILSLQATTALEGIFRQAPGWSPRTYSLR